MRRLRVSDRELDRRLRDAVRFLIDDEVPSLARAVEETTHRLFPLHCPRCAELPHDDGSHCPALRRERQAQS